MRLGCRFGALLVLAAALLPPEITYGQTDEVRLLIGLVGGSVRPLGKMKSDAKGGFMSGISADATFGHVAAGFHFSYSRFGNARYTVTTGYGGADSVWYEYTWRLFQLGAHGALIFIPSWPVSPFVKAGGSVYLTKRVYAQSEWRGHTDERLAGGYNIGSGIVCRLGSGVQGTLEASFNQFDRLDEIHLWGPNTDLPALEYWWRYPILS